MGTCDGTWNILCGADGAIWGAVILAPSFISEFNAILISTVRFGFYGLISLIIALPNLGSAVANLAQLPLAGMQATLSLPLYLSLFNGLGWAAMGG